MPNPRPQTDNRSSLFGLMRRRRGVAPEEYEPEIDVDALFGEPDLLPSPTPTPGAGPLPVLSSGPTPPPFDGYTLDKSPDGGPVILDEPLPDMPPELLMQSNAPAGALGGFEAGKSLEMDDFDEWGDAATTSGGMLGVPDLMSLGRRLVRRGRR